MSQDENIQVTVKEQWSPRHLNKPLKDFPKSFISKVYPHRGCYYMEILFDPRVNEAQLSSIFGECICCRRDDQGLRVTIVVTDRERNFIRDLYESMADSGVVDHAEVSRIISRANTVFNIEA